MSDRIIVQRQFRKALWICPCGQEDYTDLNVGTPSTYEHNCSHCGKWSNSFKEYNGVISYPPDKEPKEEDVEKEKTARVEAWVYDIKNPAPYVEPKASDIQAEIDSKLQEIQSLEARKQEISAKEAIIG